MTTAPFGFLRVAAACPPVRIADPERNVDATLEFIAKAADQGAQVLVLPELGITGYTCGDLFFSLTRSWRGGARARTAAARDAGEADGRGRRPSGAPGRAALQRGRGAAGGRILGVVPKTFLPGYKEYYEERWF